MSADARLLPFGLGFLGLGLVAISMFLPVWDEGSVSAFAGISENTLLQSGDGWITLIFAGVSAVSLVRVLASPRRIYWPLISGLVAIGFAVWLGTDEEQRTLCPLGATTVTSACQVAQPGIGVYVLGLGGAALVASGLMFWRFPKRVRVTSRPGTFDPMKVTRECPYCKSEIRPDASVCPHCRRESPPWTLKNNIWWRQDEGSGEWLWLDPEGPPSTWQRYEPAAD